MPVGKLLHRAVLGVGHSVCGYGQTCFWKCCGRMARENNFRNSDVVFAQGFECGERKAATRADKTHSGRAIFHGQYFRHSPEKTVMPS